MKSIKIIIGVLFLSSLLSSCGSLSISQKRYSRGLNIDLFSSKDEKPMEFKANKAQKNQPKSGIAQNEVKPSSTNSESIEQVSSITNKPENNKNNEEITEPKQIKSGLKAKLIQNKLEKTIEKTIEKTEKQVNSVNSPKSTNESNTSTVLLVILSLFPLLALLAIYLHQGEINSYFWIDLLLHLTIIGYVIFALLVVLDVI